MGDLHRSCSIRVCHRSRVMGRQLTLHAGVPEEPREKERGWQRDRIGYYAPVQPQASSTGVRCRNGADSAATQGLNPQL